MDLTQFMVLGKNELVLKCDVDMSRYLFVVHAHHPTRAQLQEVASRQKAKQQWYAFLMDAARPLDIPASRFTNGSGQ